MINNKKNISEFKAIEFLKNFKKGIVWENRFILSGLVIFIGLIFYYLLNQSSNKVKNLYYFFAYNKIVALCVSLYVLAAVLIVASYKKKFDLLWMNRGRIGVFILLFVFPLYSLFSEVIDLSEVERKKIESLEKEKANQKIYQNKRESEIKFKNQSKIFDSTTKVNESLQAQVNNLLKNRDYTDLQYSKDSLLSLLEETRKIKENKPEEVFDESREETKDEEEPVVKPPAAKRPKKPKKQPPPQRIEKKYTGKNWFK